MNQRYDAIIIGAGIIGCCIGYEMAKKGYKTLNVDKLPAAGQGSTVNSCGIIRTHYSTWDGAAIAYEGTFYWRDWEAYLGAQDELNNGITAPQSLVSHLIVGLDRRQQDRANDERNQQA